MHQAGDDQDDQQVDEQVDEVDEVDEHDRGSTVGGDPVAQCSAAEDSAEYWDARRADPVARAALGAALDRSGQAYVADSTRRLVEDVEDVVRNDSPTSGPLAHARAAVDDVPDADSADATEHADTADTAVDGYSDDTDGAAWTWSG